MSGRMGIQLPAALLGLAIGAAAPALSRHPAVAAERGTIPSFSRQTGLRCNQCHTTFPYLTPFGRRFKLNGYTLSGLRLIEAGDTSTRTLSIALISPVSAMVQASITQIKRPRPGTQDGTAELPQQLSLFLGEAITPKVGTFLQFTYDAGSGSFGMDNADIRFANHSRLGAKELIYGISLNNNPTVQDVWHGSPAWRFPFAWPSVAPTPAAAPLLDGALAHRVAGLGGYGLWDNRVYGEFSLYRSAPQGGPHPPNAGAQRTLNGVAPYWRVVVQHGWQAQYLEVGSYGISTGLYPTGVTGPADRFTDVGFDAQYERRIGQGNVTAHATWIHETRALDGSVAAGAAASAAGTLNTFRIDGSYYTPGRVGFTVSYFSTSGSADDSLYAASVTRKPTSSGVIGELDFLPWLNTRFTLQYVAYATFNGARRAYDGARDAPDNNTLYLLAWLVF